MKDKLVATVLAELSACGDLEEPGAFLRDGEWDEPPLYTRLAHLAFLDGLAADDKNRTLIGAALLHLDRIVSAAASELPITRLQEYLCVVTVMNWGRREPVLPCFLVSTRVQEEFGELRLMPARSPEGLTVVRWLHELEADVDFTVKDDVAADSVDRELFRVYVGHKRHPHPSMPTIDSFEKE